jgi:hypothetical protein
MRVGLGVGMRRRRRIIGLGLVGYRKAIGGRGRRGVGIGVDPVKGILGVISRMAMDREMAEIQVWRCYRLELVSSRGRAKLRTKADR